MASNPKELRKDGNSSSLLLTSLSATSSQNRPLTKERCSGMLLDENFDAYSPISLIMVDSSLRMIVDSSRIMVESSMFRAMLVDGGSSTQEGTTRAHAELAQRNMKRVELRIVMTGVRFWMGGKGIVR